MTFVDKAYEHNQFKNNSSATRQHYSVGKWNNVGAISNPNDKINYGGSVKKFGMDYIDSTDRRQNLSHKNSPVPNLNWHEDDQQMEYSINNERSSNNLHKNLIHSDQNSENHTNNNNYHLDKVETMHQTDV